MRLIQFYRYILILSFIFLASLNAKIHAPIGNEKEVKLTMGEKEWIYYKLDKNGLIYNDIGREYDVNDSIQVEINSRSIMGVKSTKKYGFTVQINNNEPLELKYKKDKSQLKNPNRLGWDYIST